MNTELVKRVLSLGFLPLLVALLVQSNAESDPPICETFSAWSEPVNLGPVVNSSSFDSAATFSPDGLSLYFVSTRPGGLGMTDIWISQRRCADCPWEPPVNLAMVNSAVADGGPSLSADGHLLFFHSDRPGGHGGSDIWLSRRVNPNDDFGWEPPVNVGEAVNTPASEFTPDYVQTGDFYVENAGSAPANVAALYFGRGPDVSNQDMYAAPLTRDGQTAGPAVLVSELNSNTNDASPTVRTDGKEILFWSLRPGGFGNGDIWVSTRPTAHDPWSTPENVGLLVNTSSTDARPNLSRSGRTLLFDSNRPGGQGNQDVWMSTRTPGCR
jgi:Tol biopolymer transport system component